MNIILYKTMTCSQCKVVKAKLDAKGLSYTEITDNEVMAARGITSIPQLQIDDNTPMEGVRNICRWIDSQEATNG